MLLPHRSVRHGQGDARRLILEPPRESVARNELARAPTAWAKSPHTTMTVPPTDRRSWSCPGYDPPARDCRSRGTRTSPRPERSQTRLGQCIEQTVRPGQRDTGLAYQVPSRLQLLHGGLLTATNECWEDGACDRSRTRQQQGYADCDCDCDTPVACRAPAAARWSGIKHGVTEPHAEPLAPDDDTVVLRDVGTDGQQVVLVPLVPLDQSNLEIPGTHLSVGAGG